MPCRVDERVSGRKSKELLSLKSYDCLVYSVKFKKVVQDLPVPDPDLDLGYR
jgi:hypothetical protein